MMNHPMFLGIFRLYTNSRVDWIHVLGRFEFIYCYSMYHTLHIELYLIRKPRKVDQGQRVPPKVRNSKNLVETLAKEGCRTQKTPKAVDPGTK